MKNLRFKFSKLLVGTSIALMSLKIFLGGLFGYLLAQSLSGKFDSVILSIGSYKFHFHHWLMGAFGLGLVIAYEISPLMNQLFYGFMGGVIFQGISSYPDWSKVFFKK